MGSHSLALPPASVAAAAQVTWSNPPRSRRSPGATHGGSPQRPRPLRSARRWYAAAAAVARQVRPFTTDS
eukprot:2815382-Prymnesium_polylepis.1